MLNKSSNLSPISYAIRFSAVAKYLGFMLLVALAVVIVPFISSIIWHDYTSSIRYAVVIIVFLVLGMLSFKIPKPNILQANEAYVIIALTFVIGSLALVFPMMASGLGFIDSWFEAVSNLTTTGLSVMDPDMYNQKIFLFSRAWMQWYGGLGIVILSLGMAMQPGDVSKSISATVLNKEDLVEMSRVFARKIWIIYGVLTLLAIIALKITGFSLFDAITLAFGAISTGGFSSYENSISELSYPVQFLIMIITFMGALYLPLFWVTSIKKFKTSIKNAEMLSLIIFCLLFSILITFLFPLNWEGFFPKAILNVTFLQTTAGYTTFDVSTLNTGSKLLLILSMFIGGSTQSTAGGFKLIRMIIVVRSIDFLFFRTSLSKHAATKTLDRQDKHESYICFALFFLYIATIFISTLLFVIMGHDPLNSLFEVVSATSTVGASMGITGPHLPLLLKSVLIFDMLLGRLEMVTLLVLIYPKTLIGRRLSS